MCRSPMPQRGRRRPVRQAAPGPVRRVHPRPGLLAPAELGSRPAPPGLQPREGRGIVTASTASGTTVRAGLSICFEVAYADLVRDVVTHGANLRRPDEQRHLLVHRRVRATARGEPDPRHGVRSVGRPCLHSRCQRLVTPDGTPHLTTSLFTTALLSGVLPLRDDSRRGAAGTVARALAGVLLLAAAAHTVGWPGDCAAAVGSVIPAARKAVMQTTDDRLTRVVVLIPTYNERENLPQIVARCAATPHVDILILEDNSRTAPVRWPTRWRPPTLRCTSCTGPERPGWGRLSRRLPVGARPWV